ncbi:hypothetical protein Asch01_00182 [Acinetobacter schindleri]|uniref:hypothetical protein n=1 Tax=Acinetobacter schindleri TaxID=108981 RepID=UPI0030B7E900
MLENTPHTFEDVIETLGGSCNHKKIADLIMNGKLEVCFRYDGIIGVINEFIPFIHNGMDSLMLKNELIDTKKFGGWLFIDTDTIGLHELLYKKLNSIKITNAFCKQCLATKSPKQTYALLNEDIEFYELYGNIDHPKILSYQLTFDDLRVSIESLNNYIDSINSKTKINKTLNPSNESQLSTLLDETHPYYAPDLALAVQLWIECYKDQKPYSASHESTVNDFLKRNYEAIEMATKAKERIQEISSPFKNWGSERKKRSNHTN